MNSIRTYYRRLKQARIDARFLADKTRVAQIIYQNDEREVCFIPAGHATPGKGWYFREMTIPNLLE